MLVLLFAILSAVYCLVPINDIDNPECIPGEYIVVFHQNVTNEVAQAEWDLLEAAGVEIINRYDNLNTFHAKLTDDMVAALQRHPMVFEMGLNCKVYAFQTCTSSSGSGSWGLPRTSYGGSTSGGQMPANYNYPSTGSGVYAYVLDTGIYTAHSQFSGRARWGTNTIDSSNSDGNGHGTHCAGTIGGSTYGIAKGVNLVAVKVLSASGGGSEASILNGINWVITDCQPTQYKCLISMSLGGSGTSTGIHSAIQRATTAGIPVVVAAGNDNANACNTFPARYPECITVGATDRYDARSTFSNYGTCVDIFAPGTGITSAWIGSTTATNTISGTSMATPHVAGQVAILLQQGVAGTYPAMEDRLKANANKNRISNPGTGSPNNLLYNQCA